MKITSVRVLHIDRYLYALVDTDAGITGLVGVLARIVPFQPTATKRPPPQAAACSGSLVTRSRTSSQ